MRVSQSCPVGLEARGAKEVTGKEAQISAELVLTVSRDKYVDYLRLGALMIPHILVIQLPAWAAFYVATVRAAPVRATSHKIRARLAAAKTETLPRFFEILLSKLMGLKAHLTLLEALQVFA